MIPWLELSVNRSFVWSKVSIQHHLGMIWPICLHNLSMCCLLSFLSTKDGHASANAALSARYLKLCMMKTGLRALDLNLHCTIRVISFPSTLSCLVEFSRRWHGCRGQQEQNKFQGHNTNYSWYRKEKVIKREEARGCKKYRVLV